MNLAERLRSVVRPGGSAAQSHVCSADAASPADLLGGEWREWQGHRFLVIDRRYPPGHRHGRCAVVDSAPDASGSWPSLSVLEAAAAGRAVLFLDLETTGLSGGAGTYAFLVGCGWFEPPSPAASAGRGGGFRIRQFLLTAYAAERGLLEAVRETTASAGAIATYNGKSFDLPVIDTRCVLHRMPTLFDGMPHVDMLHPARQVWRDGATDSCRLAAMEAAVLGHVREDDVPGFEIPARYFHYVRSGDSRPLDAVLEHNRLDLLSLAMLTAHLARLLEEGADAAGTAREAVGLGRLYQRDGRLAEARGCFQRASRLDGDEHARAEALRAYAVLCRRAREHEEAADAWQRLLELPTCPPHVAWEAREALAVHCEHRLRDLRTARQLAMASFTSGASTARARAMHHRVARLDRKLASPLF